jgi:G3E family GTPase
MTLPVTILGGYLGAGKTTLLNRILTGSHGQRVGVIVNDFGSLNVDARLIVAHDGDTVSLANGCVCCSASDGTGEALAGFIRRADSLDRIVIEMSGVAEPARLAQNVAAFRLPVDGVIVLVDAEQLPAQLANRYVGRTVARSLSQADLIVVNKLDIASPGAVAATEAALDQHAGTAPRVRAVQADIPLAVLFGLDRVGSDLPAWETDHASAHVTWLWENRRPLTQDDLEAMAAELACKAVRAKGHVLLAPTPDKRQLYQQVGRRWTLTADGEWGAETPTTRIVAIAIRESVAGLWQGARLDSLAATPNLERVQNSRQA